MSGCLVLLNEFLMLPLDIPRTITRVWVGA